MVQRLLDFKGDDAAINDRVVTEVRLTPVVPGCCVVRGHYQCQQAGGGMDGAFHVLLLAARAEHLNSHGGCSPSRSRAEQPWYQSRTIGHPMKFAGLSDVMASAVRIRF